MQPSLSAILYLQRRIIGNWFRRSLRSPIFWLVAIFIGFAIFAQVAAVIDEPDPGVSPDWMDISTVVTVAVIALAGGVLIGLWRGTTNTPTASLADVVVMMGSPISSRLQFAVLMARTSLINSLVIGTWAFVGSGGLILGIDDGWIAIRVIVSATSIVLLSEFLRNAVWVGTEQMIARSPESGYRLRRGIRFVVAGMTVALAWTLLEPALTGADEGWRGTLATIVEQSDVLTVIPPMSFIASLLNPGGMSLLSGIALILLVVGVAALALYWARDFVEPIAVTAEHATDARGQMLEVGSDVQWAVLAQYGVSPRMKVSVPTFGGGVWAMVWGGVNRWVRYQIAAAWITIVIYALLGLATALGVHLEYVSVEIAWAVVLMFPFFGSVNMFMDELRRPFIFLIPGSAWTRLLAGAVTSILDGLVSCLLMIVVLMVTGVIPLSHAAGLLVLGLTIALLAQASLALVQVLLPIWLKQRTRVMITFGVTTLAFLPALGVLIAVYIAIGPLASLLAAAGVTAVAGIGVLIVAGLLFEGVEYSG